MKATGIVRRIDDLGRIVIPKEIRRTMRIREGDPMEIFLEDGGVFFKKYSTLSDFSDMAENAIKSINGKFELIVTDRDQVIASSSKMYQGVTLSDEYLDTIVKKIHGSEVVLIRQNDSEKTYIYMVPIVVCNDVIGSVSATNYCLLSKCDIEVIQYIAKSIGNYVETKGI